MLRKPLRVAAVYLPLSSGSGTKTRGTSRIPQTSAAAMQSNAAQIRWELRPATLGMKSAPMRAPKAREKEHADAEDR